MIEAPGWLSTRSCGEPKRILIEHAKNVAKNGAVLELGALFGSTTQILANNLDPTCNIFVIDLWFDVEIKKLPQVQNTILKKIIGESDKNVIKGDNVYKWWKFFTNDFTSITHYRQDVINVDKSLLPQFDLIIQDAQHTYEGILEELEYWWPKLKSKGILIIDDYNNDLYPGLVQATKEFFAKNEYATKIPTDSFLLIVTK